MGDQKSFLREQERRDAAEAERTGPVAEVSPAGSESVVVRLERMYGARESLLATMGRVLNDDERLQTLADCIDLVKPLDAALKQQRERADLAERRLAVLETLRERVQLMADQLVAAMQETVEARAEGMQQRGRAERAEAQLRALTGTVECHEDVNGEWVPYPMTEGGGTP